MMSIDEEEEVRYRRADADSITPPSSQIRGILSDHWFEREEFLNYRTFGIYCEGLI